jgi:hypothetical protein
MGPCNSASQEPRAGLSLLEGGMQYIWLDIVRCAAMADAPDFGIK